MSVGSIATSILTDIANAIRYQAGVATLYQPRQMAAAVAALDGSNAGNYQAQSYMQLERGYLATDVFGDIADAIRAQNGTQTQYLPEEMAAAILALTWDVGLKGRALLLDDGTLELNYLSSRQTTLSGRTIVSGFEVDVNGYSSEASRPWDASAVRNAVEHVYIDSSFASFGLTNLDYFFKGMTNLVDVTGFENLTGVTNAYLAFGACSALESIYATSFTNVITSGTYMFNGCTSLVGGTDGKCVSTTSMGANLCKLGTGGVLTDPNNDTRVWFHGFMYSDGSVVLSVSGTANPNKTLASTGRICANANYTGASHLPWGALGQSSIVSAEFAADMAGLSYLNLNYLFYSCSNLASVSGLGNLPGVRSMRYTFAGCSSLVSIDFSGFDPSTLTDLFYCFSTCSALTTILADSTWALPSSGISGSNCFYNCSASLVGGNGTVWSSSNTGYQYMVIDTAGTPGYLTGV